MQTAALVVHLPPGLQQGAQSGGAKKRHAAHVDRDRFCSCRYRMKERDLQLVCSFAVTTTSYDEFMCVSVGAFLNNHDLHIDES